MRRILGRYPFERMEAPPSKVVHDYAEWAAGLERIILSRPAYVLCSTLEYPLTTKH
jgi:hypothetical protein